jgi:hypothetical protein
MKKLLLTFLFGSIAILYFSLATAEETTTRLEPVDESAKNASFVKFKKELRDAIQKKDSSFIKKILSDDVEYSFGADPDRKSAIDGFLKHYNIEDKKNSEFWKNFQEAVDLGCTKSGEDFICPYVYTKWPDKFDSFLFVVTTGEKIPIRKKPETAADILRFTNFEILKIALEQKTDGWRTIDLGNKQIGYVAKSDVRSPIDYRAQFSKTSEGWKLKYFIAGD